MTLRKFIFWLHLVAGLVAGIVILVMSATGAALAYEKEVIAWAERDAQRVTAPTGVSQLPIDELIARARAARPDFQPTSVIVKSDPGAAVTLSLGRSGALYVNPYTGDVRSPEPTAWRSFMSTMVAWHRYIALSGDNRALGKAITGACNAAFLVLGVTGLYLWWPRTWSKRALGAITTMRFNLRGKARDFNWHNAVGLWSAIPIIIMSATALPISYAWAGNLLNKLNGPDATPPAGPITLPPPAPGAKRLAYQPLLSAVQQQVPAWKQITLNLGGPAAGGGRQPGGIQPVTFSVREANRWPRTATTTLALDPFTGETVRREGYEDLPLGRQVRAWTRYLHTGEALGPLGQGIAGLGSLGGVLLVWTGFTLSWRRFFGRRTAVHAEKGGPQENETAPR